MDVKNESASSGEMNRQESVITVESYLDASDKDKVQRKLHQRHVQMYVEALFSYSAHPDTRKGLP